MLQSSDDDDNRNKLQRMELRSVGIQSSNGSWPLIPFKSVHK